MEELSVEELEAKLDEIRKLNDKKSEELNGIEQQRKKELLEKIRAAQQEGIDLDEQIAEAKGKRIGNKMSNKLPEIYKDNLLKKNFQ